MWFVKWMLKMVDIELSIESGHLRIIVEFAGTVIIDRSIDIGVGQNMNWSASPKGMI